MTDTLQAIEYRRLVASIASQLSPEELERILFIRSAKLDEASEEGAENPSPLHALAALERQGEFSLQNIDGLAEIAKDVNRHDLVRLVACYKKTRCAARKPLKKATPKKIRKHSEGRRLSRFSSTSRERSHLEETHEMLVTRFTFLEQQMSLIPRLLEGDGDIQDEGTVILTSLKHAADELAAKLTEALHEFFQEFSSDDGSSSTTGSIGGSCEDLRRRDIGSEGGKKDELISGKSVLMLEQSSFVSRDICMILKGENYFETFQ